TALVTTLVRSVFVSSQRLIQSAQISSVVHQQRWSLLDKSMTPCRAWHSNRPRDGSNRAPKVVSMIGGVERDGAIACFHDNRGVCQRCDQSIPVQKSISIRAHSWWHLRQQ